MGASICVSGKGDSGMGIFDGDEILAGMVIFPAERLVHVLYPSGKIAGEGVG